jgi:predicted Ser/Thr protein kinase
VSQTNPAAAGPSEIAGRYQVVQKLGAGAFGTVYKAKDKILGRMVAIKTIRLEGLAAAGASLEELVERFKREAQVSAQLKHPNIVTIYDVGEADGISYLAMEFIDGVGLDRVIAGAGRLAIERAASIGAQIADALDFAHKNGVVHRDIKPANIMIETGDRVKVTDFGIAKVTSGEHLTMTGSLLGTPSYMSPEQARGGDLDGRSDLFAVGCILYEMLAGQKAFRGESITALIFKIITEEPPAISSLDPTVPEDMIRIITRALSKLPETRYQSGRELTDALLVFTRAGATPTIRQSELATAPGTAPRPAAATDAPPTVAAAAPTHAGAAPTQVTPAAATRLMPTPPPPQAPAAPDPRPQARAQSVAPPARKTGSGAGLLIALGLVGLLFVGGAAGALWYFVLRKPAGPNVADNATETTANSSSANPTPTLAQPPPVSDPPATAAAATADPGTSAPATLAPVASDSVPARDTQATTRPRDTGRPPRDPGTTARPPEAADVAPPPTRTSGDASFLDEEPPETIDGNEAGERTARAYRSDQGRSSTSLGTSGRFRARPKSPRGLAPMEKPAVAVLRYLINAEEAYKVKHGRYGTFVELSAAQTLQLDVTPQPRQFARRNYRFELKLDGDDFSVMAMPAGMGGRPFIGDNSGYIREGLE